MTETSTLGFSKDATELFQRYLANESKNRKLFTKDDEEFHREILTDPDKNAPVEQTKIERQQFAAAKHYALKHYRLDGDLLMRKAARRQDRDLWVAFDYNAFDHIARYHNKVQHQSVATTYRALAEFVYGISREDVKFLLSLCEICREKREKRSSRDLLRTATASPQDSNEGNGEDKQRIIRFVEDEDQDDEDSRLQSEDTPTRGRPLNPRRTSVFAETANSSSLIVGPALAQDAHILETYLAYGSGNRSFRPNPYHVFSKDANQPVLYMKVPRRHGGYSKHKIPGREQCEIIERFLGPLAPEILDLYFREINFCFPLIDSDNFQQAYQENKESIPPALRCQIYATTLTFWQQSSILAIQNRPDPSFVWSLAVQALNDDFLAPGMSTVSGAILCLTGRPITTITGNAVNLGRTVALAHSLGLNRNPNGWNVSPKEKKIRIRVWWTVLIHDHW
jgi:hypothetical protein